MFSCASPVGREGGKQNISLGDPECGKHGTILHEIGWFYVYIYNLPYTFYY